MSEIKSGVSNFDGVQVFSLEGLWDRLSEVPTGHKLAVALEYAGCDFYDNERNFVKDHSISLVGLGGVPLATPHDSIDSIRDRLLHARDGSKVIMASSAALSYLNNGEKSLPDLYQTVTSLGHFSLAHTIQANIVVAGITEAAEMELSLQRDLVHISKLTNARTSVQNHPPLVVRNPLQLDAISELYDKVINTTESLRITGDGDSLELVNGLFPTSKATLLMLSGDLSNFRKLASLRNDKGKEREMRDVAGSLHDQLSILWPEIMNERSDR